MLEVINAVVTGVGLVALEALRQRGQKETTGKLQTLREDLEQRLREHEELIRQLRNLNQALKGELEACWADRDALQRRILAELGEPSATKSFAPSDLDLASDQE